MYAVTTRQSIATHTSQEAVDQTALGLNASLTMKRLIILPQAMRIAASNAGSAVAKRSDWLAINWRQLDGHSSA